MLFVLPTVSSISACHKRPAATSVAAAPLADLPDAPAANQPAWLPEDCVESPVPDTLAAYDCEDGSSFTMRQARSGVRADELLEAQWHEALGLLEIAGANVSGSVDRTCTVGAVQGDCRVISAESGETEARYVVATADDGDRLLAVDCVDLTAGPRLHPVCRRFLKIDDLPE